MSIKLRPWQIEDVSAVARYANDPLVAQWLRDSFPSPYTMEDARWFIEHNLAHPDEREKCLAIDLDGESIGSISFELDDTRPKSAEIGYWLGAPHWRKGYGTKAVLLLCEQIFTDYPDVVFIKAETFAENHPSRLLLEHCGFRLAHSLKQSVRKEGAYCDSCIYERTRPGTELGQLYF